MRPTAPPLGTAPRGRFMLPVTRLRVGRLALLGLVIATTLIGGTVWPSPPRPANLRRRP